MNYPFGTVAHRPSNSSSGIRLCPTAVCINIRVWSGGQCVMLLLSPMAVLVVGKRLKKRTMSVHSSGGLYINGYSLIEGGGGGGGRTFLIFVAAAAARDDGEH